MKSKDLDNPKIKSKIIMCKNCHQNILEEKMFLHEGFCTRNNIFCEICEKVFLKKDYDQHFKSIHKKKKINKNDSFSQKEKTQEMSSESGQPYLNKEQNDNDINDKNEKIEPLYPIPSLEYVQMPATEVFQINNPIIIAEDGQIVSTKNKNEFLLPYLGINTFQNSAKSEEILDGIISQGEIFKENNTLIRNTYNIDELENIINKENINRANTNININGNYRDSNSSNTREIINTIFNNNNYYKKSKSFAHSINCIDSNINDNNDNSLNLINSNTICEDNNTKNNNIIINNNIITYNSNKNINKIHNYFPNNENQQKTPNINSLKNKSIIRNTLENIPSNNYSIGNHQSLMNNNFINNGYENNFTGKKEPKDSYSRNTYIYQSSGQKIKQNMPFKPYSATGKNHMTKRCEFCNSIFKIEDINYHYKNCKNKEKKNIRKFDIPMPKKIEKLILSKRLNTDNNNKEEKKRIDEKKKETLNREFNEALNLISLNNDKKLFKGMISNPERKDKTRKIIKEYPKHHFKKKLFDLNDKNEKGDSPEDSKKFEMTERIQQKRNKLKRINNMSVDGNNFEFEKCMNEIKFPNQSKEEIDPWLYFYDHNKKNNGKIGLYKKEKNKKIIRNSFEKYKKSKKEIKNI